MSAPLVSVVTPVYNGGRHLTECIESVLRQTYENWEYVVVDNCSSDETPKIAEQFTRVDRRVRYVRHSEFVDVIASFNRSFGAVAEDSVYCKPLGADDWLFPECLSRMVVLAEKHPSVGVVGGYRLNGRRVDLVGFPYWEETQPGREVIAADVRTPLELIGAPTALMFRRELMKKRTPFYDETFRHADTEAVYWALSRSDFGVVHQVVTYNREATSPETVSSNRLASYDPELLRMLIRYGPSVLPPEQYRDELRVQLKAYERLMLRAFAGWHAKRRFQRGPARNEDFHAFQVRALDLISEEASDDPDIRRTVSRARKLLEWY